MRDFSNRIGQVFGRLTVVDVLKAGLVSVRCECGIVKTVRYTDLQLGKIVSCGCWNKEKIRERSITHNQTNTKLYRTWTDIKKRCYNKKSISYINYGGRGIKMCEEWKDNFQNFYDWAIAHDYSEKSDLSIDRIDVNGNYEPSNCRWANRKQQSRNKRNTRYLTYKGETHCLFDWAELLGVSVVAFIHRVERGWDIDRIFNQPYRKRGGDAKNE